VVLDKLKVRKQRRFGFNEDNALVLKKGAGNQPEVMPDRKFWVFNCGSDHDDDPYGRGLAHWLYWPVWFKRNDVKFWLMLIDKLGIPTTKGTYPKGTTKAEQDKFLETIAQIQNEAAMVLPEGMMVELIEAARQGSVGQEQLYDRMNEAISKVVLSQTMTTDDGASQSQSQVHMEVRQDVTESDADLIDASATATIVTWLCSWNYPGAGIPQVRRDFEEPEDANTIAERDKKLWDMGARPTTEYAERQYPGWKFRETAETMEASPPGTTADDKAPVFAEPDQVDQLVAEILAMDDWPTVMQAIIGPIEELMNASASFEEFAVRAAEALRKMDVNTLAEKMARALFAARLAGLVGAALDDHAHG
jgi:phage gp29-like protein